MPYTNPLCEALQEAKDIALEAEEFNPEQKQQFINLINFLLRQKGCRVDD